MTSSDPRTLEQIRHHYEVEKELGNRLRHSTREERTRLFSTLYNELFERVPDHARITRRDSEASALHVQKQMRLLRPNFDGAQVFLEFAPGDCRLSLEMSKHVGKVYGVDISDQTGGIPNLPDNFELILYDGYHVDLPDASMDLAFSYQFLEHLHPDDVPLHFELIHRLLKPGGRYIFSTPHLFSGPHDISRFFSDVPDGFHLKEWTYREMGRVIELAGFSAWHPFRFGKVRTGALAKSLTSTNEALFSILPRKLQRKCSERLFQAVTMMVVK